MIRNNEIITAPILIIAFNRPTVSVKTFEYIRKAKPTKLYIAVDGAREGKVGEDKLVEEVKSILQKIDWPCEAHFKYNETNKGAEVTVSSAISWVFETEEYAIVLEDDIIAPMSFLRFAQEMLIKYKDNDKIDMVTGNNFTPINQSNNYSYYFTKYGHHWGWATWKRAWKDFDLYLEIPKVYTTYKKLKEITNTKKEAKYFSKYFEKLKKRGVGNVTWDAIKLYRQIVHRKLTITPANNLTSNIGIFGLHAKGQTEHHFRPFDESFVVKNHPNKIECNVSYDIKHFETYIFNKKKPLTRLKNKLLKLLKVKS